MSPRCFELTLTLSTGRVVRQRRWLADDAAAMELAVALVSGSRDRRRRLAELVEDGYPVEATVRPAGEETT